MTREEFKKLRPGDQVGYAGEIVTVKRWLELGYTVEYICGRNTKIIDPWLNDMRVYPPECKDEN